MSRTSSTMSVVAHLVITIPVEGHKPRLPTTANHYTLEGQGKLSCAMRPCFVFKEGKVYRFKSLKSAAEAFGKALGSGLKDNMRNQGWHRFVDGVFFWDAEKGPPAFMTPALEGLCDS